jgi:antitoxin VapB
MEMAKIFQNGKSQAVRLPKKFRFRGNKVIIKKMGEGVILLPYNDPWRSLTESLKLFSDDFMETRDQPKQQTRKDL